MAKKNKPRTFKSLGDFVYSTNPDYQPEEEQENVESLGPSEQLLHLHRETKGRAGKAVAIVRGFEGTEDELKDLAKELKAHCGTGGSVKDGEIIIQGDQREKVDSYLRSKGYKTKRVGG